MTQPTPARARLALTLATATRPYVWDVLAITAGEGNGWTFPADVLRASLARWHNVPCFVDHAPLWENPSVKDLAGLLTSPRWDESAQGIAATLSGAGPGIDTLAAAAGAYLATDRALPLGLSADLSFYATDRKVTEIDQVYSVDLVAYPARGGTIVQPAEPPAQGETQMSQTTPPTQDPTAGLTRATLTTPPPAAPDATALQRQLTDLQVQLAVTQAGLPAALADLVRAQFRDQVSVPPELLQEALTLARSAQAALAAPPIKGPAVSGMTTTEDQLQAAVDDLLGAPRAKEQLSVKPARLSGIRELYHMLTGDYDLHGGYYADRARLATTSDFTGLVTNSLNKIVVNQWGALGRAGYDWWTKVSTVEHFNSVNTITGTLMGSVGSLPTVAEGAEYTELAVGDSPETGTFYKYGGYIPLTLELIDRDDSRKLASYPKELANAGLRKLSGLVAAIFTSNSSVGPTLADGGALFNNTAVTTAGGHANLLTTALASAEWEVVSAAVYNQPLLIKNATGYYGTGSKMAVNPRFCLVPRALQLTACEILYPTLKNASQIYSENQQRGQPGDVITVPEWTDATDWAAVCDPAVAPSIYVGERFGIMPEIFIAGDSLSPAVFTNDEHRIKVRHFLAVWVNDFRPLHKSNV